MASVWRHPNSKYFTACFRDHDGRQRRISTKEADKKKARAIAEEFEKAVRTKRTLRQVQAVLDRLHTEIAGEPVSRTTLRQYAAEWLSAKSSVVGQSTLEGYRGGVEQLLIQLGERAEAPMSELTKADLLAYRAQLAATLTPRTVNNRLNLVRMLLKSARRDGVLMDDPAEFLDAVRERGNLNKRRPFSLAELQAVLAVADLEWRSMIMFGLYTGQRLADIVRIEWHNIDLDRNEIRMITGKTGRTMVIPIALPLRAHIDSLPASDAPDAPLHPRAYAVLARSGGRSGVLSQHFADLLAQAGLRQHQPHRARGSRCDRRRSVGALSFHSLRRTATTWLHEAGVADAVAQALIGHASKAVHDRYVSVGRDALKAAIGTFPQV
jgi:integrase